MRKKIVLAIICCICLMLMACGNSEKKVENNKSSEAVKTADYDSYFLWSDNEIIGLTDEGKNAEELVVPEHCTKVRLGSFTSDTYTEPNTTVKKISFESNDTLLEDGFAYYEALEDVVLPGNLTVLPESCFMNCTELKFVSIPESVEEIPSYCFITCTNLEKITMGNNIKNIGQYAFQQCEKLIEIDLGESLETIEAQAFQNCYVIERIELPNTVKTIGKMVFTGCNNLKEIYIPESVESIDSTALAQLSGNIISVYVKEGSYADTAFEEYGSVASLEKQYY